MEECKDCVKNTALLKAERKKTHKYLKTFHHTMNLEKKFFWGIVESAYKGNVSPIDAIKMLRESEFCPYNKIVMDKETML